MKRQYFTLANGITAFRLAIFFIGLWYLGVGATALAIGLFAVAWGLDAVDGLAARWRGEESEFGSQFDKIVDRIIMALGLFAFIRVELLPPEAILLLTKDIALLPATSILAAQEKNDPGLGKFGKTVTFLQGVAVIILLIHALPAYEGIIIGGVAAIGFVAAYWHLLGIVRA